MQNSVVTTKAKVALLRADFLASRRGWERDNCRNQISLTENRSWSRDCLNGPGVSPLDHGVLTQAADSTRSTVCFLYVYGLRALSAGAVQMSHKRRVGHRVTALPALLGHQSEYPFVGFPSGVLIESTE
jgi:hypothetical protein